MKFGETFMRAFPPMKSAGKHAAEGAIFLGLVCAPLALAPLQSRGAFAGEASIPNFSPSSAMGWLKVGGGDEFASPESGPGPVVYDTKVNPAGNFVLTPGNPRAFKVGDISNPILQPWVVAQMKKSNDEEIGRAHV